MQIVRLVAATLLAAVSFLVFFNAGHIFLFELTLLATEYGHWLAVFCLFLAGLFHKKTLCDRLAVLFLIIGAGIYSLPLIQAGQVIGKMADQVQATFPTNQAPLSFDYGRLWWSEKVVTITPQTFVYARHAEENLSLLFYPATGSKNAPCIVVLHTGGWSTGSPNEFQKMNSWLAGRGFAVAAIEYRLAPRWVWPAQRDDLLDAMKYLKENHAHLGLDPSRFVLLGRSAGGQIAEAVAYGCPDPAVRGCIALYAPADLFFAYRYADPHDILNSLKLLKDYTGGTPETVPENYRTGSGIRLVTPMSPPTLLLHGRRDELVWVRQSQRLAVVLQENNVRHLSLEFPWATHAFDWNFDGPGGQISRQVISRFLENVTR